MTWLRVVIQGGMETIPDADHLPNPCSAAVARAWLSAKARSHAGKGWVVTPDGDAFHATKAYPSGRVKDRTILIRRAGA